MWAGGEKERCPVCARDGVRGRLCKCVVPLIDVSCVCCLGEWGVFGCEDEGRGRGSAVRGEREYSSLVRVQIVFALSNPQQKISYLTNFQTLLCV